jgi:hypothetical protein
MSHAQRLLPMEQLLSGATPERAPSPERKLSLAPDARKPEPPAAPRAFISPFAADSARKGTPRSEAPENTGSPSRPASAAVSAQQVVMGSAAPAVAPAPERQPEFEAKPVSCDDVRSAVLSALTSAGQNMLASMLEGGEWQIEGGQLTIKVASSATLIDMSVSNDAKRMIIATASGVLGRAARLQIVPGANVQAATTTPSAAKPASNGGHGSSRSRAEQEPLVQRMKEKFGAEIRTVIDYRK